MLFMYFCVGRIYLDFCLVFIVFMLFFKLYFLIVMLFGGGLL